MINELDKRRLRFLVSPTRFFNHAISQDIEKAYQCWRETWGHAFQKEMNQTDHLYSDNFTRQSKVAVIFHGEHPLGVCTLNTFDLRLKQDLDDSYFKVWPDHVLDELKKDMNLVMSCCNASIDFKYRKNQLGFSGIDLLFSMIILYMKSTDIEGILGTARVQKKVPEACQRTAATFYAHNEPYTIPGQFIDLICWKRGLDVELWDPEMRELAEFIWKRSSNIYHSEEGERYAA